MTNDRRVGVEPKPAPCPAWAFPLSAEEGCVMQTRHRIPTIFNLSMVDVLCCALGCVILLWLVYFKEARSRAVAVGQSSKELSVAMVKLDDLGRDLTAAQKLLLAGSQKNQHLAGQLLEVSAQRDQLLTKLEKADKDYQNAV